MCPRKRKEEYMANRQDARHEEFWRGDPHRTHEWNERMERERREPNENTPERYRQSYGGRQSSWSGSERQRDYGHTQEQEWEPHDGYRQQRFSDRERADYGREFSERPYSMSGSNAGRSGYIGRRDPYREEGDRGHGATMIGAEWGEVGTERHRLGSLTESAAASARRASAGPLSERRSDMDYPERVNYAGRGPKGYKRADERIREDVCELLTRSEYLDASNIEVTVRDGTVMLSGSVQDRRSKRMAEDLSQDISGVTDVQNQIRVESSGSTTTGGVQVAPGSQTNTLGLNPESTRR
jgi:osmotically-inducible protein OsmY